MYDIIGAMRKYIDNEFLRIKRDSEEAYNSGLPPKMLQTLSLYYTVEAQTLYFMETELDRIEKELS